MSDNQNLGPRHGARFVFDGGLCLPLLVGVLASSEQKRGREKRSRKKKGATAPTGAKHIPPEKGPTWEEKKTDVS